MTVFRLAVVLTVLTFALLLVGGTVNPTGSSLACPDWPLCYGEVFPEMTGGVFYEHSHRMLATLVGLVTLALGFAAWKKRREAPGLWWLGLVLVVVVIVQGVLGGITVIMRLPTLVSTAHLALSMVFFLLLVQACLRAAGRSAASPVGIARGVAAVLAGATYLQVVLGGLVRHTGAGRACGLDFPTCGGELWPAWPAAQLHQFHRAFGVALGVGILAAAVFLFRAARREGRALAATAALLAPILTAVQVWLGIVTVTSGIDVVYVTLHTGVAALILAALYVAWSELGSRVAVVKPAAAEVPAAALIGEEVPT